MIFLKLKIALIVTVLTFIGLSFDETYLPTFIIIFITSFFYFIGLPLIIIYESLIDEDNIYDLLEYKCDKQFLYSQPILLTIYYIFKIITKIKQKYTNEKIKQT